MTEPEPKAIKIRPWTDHGLEVAEGLPVRYRQNDSGEMAYLDFDPAKQSARQIDEREDRGRVVDIGEDGEIVGVEFEYPYEGIDITGLPFTDEVTVFFKKKMMDVSQDPPPDQQTP